MDSRNRRQLPLDNRECSSRRAITGPQPCGSTQVDWAGSGENCGDLIALLHLFNKPEASYISKGKVTESLQQSQLIF